jgi:predicted enzyme related to lactoylglutathione lyase
MGKRERYEPGTFCWVDLATTDPAGAKAFYGELFGWEAEDMPAGEAGTYTMLRLDGDEVCALYELDAGRREQGIPSHWLSYVSVEDADATASRTCELGGTVFGEAFDVLDSGRMAIIQDPTGAVLGAWQPWTFIGARRVNDPGCLSLNQLNTSDPDRAAGFYRDLFGWEISQVADEPSYWGIDNNGWLNGGMMRTPDGAQGMPSHWLVYFVAEDLDAAADRIGELGGTMRVPPMSVPPEGRILVARDPQGAAFALFEGETDD